MDVLASEARAILEGVCAEKIRVEKDAQGYLVAATFSADGFDGQPHAGHTAIDPETSPDPRDMAERLIALSRLNAERNASRKATVEAVEDIPDAPETEEPTFPPEKDPFGPPTEEEPHVPESQEAGDSGEGVPDFDGGGDETAPEGNAGSAEDGSAGGGGALLAHDGQDGPGDSIAEPDYDYEADYEEVTPEELSDADALLELEAPDLGGEILDENPEPSGGVAYFGDDIHIARLAKLGRLSEIAREQKQALQEGWTLDEFRSLQNLIVRIDRAESPDDPVARERFLMISQRSVAMSRVDVFKDAREAELEGYAHPLDREAIAVFDPEAGWPGA